MLQIKNNNNSNSDKRGFFKLDFYGSQPSTVIDTPNLKPILIYENEMLRVRTGVVKREAVLCSLCLD